MGRSSVSSSNTHKGVSVFLRFGELVCGAVVLGLLGEFVHRVNDDGANVDGRIIYTMVVAAITILYSVVGCPPLKWQFMAFPFDFILFVMWLVAFCLLETRTGINTCSSTWYTNYWGFHWRGPSARVVFNGEGCAQWRTVLAFAFVACIVHLLSGILGIYVFQTYFRAGKSGPDSISRDEKLRSDHGDSRRATEDTENTAGVDAPMPATEDRTV